MPHLPGTLSTPDCAAPAVSSAPPAVEGTTPTACSPLIVAVRPDFPGGVRPGSGIARGDTGRLGCACSGTLLIMNDHAVLLEEVTRTYGKGATEVAALRQVSVSFPRGSFTAVMGPSGSGKSTLLQCA
ncbi:hypothetical protein GCM10022419_099600 [Nonomuraea rosea]|uniref:ABC transporter domain-containing protein n=2 Tax=Nonomuraea rosea TaxID=638574 RepID=A0ABP6Z6B0_9ACTN